MSATPIERLRAIMAKLRDPDGGCPWDVQQTFASVAPYTIEEAYEVADAIERKDMGELKGELGDLLFQSVFHARMAEEAGHFTIDDVVRSLVDKMVDRHPHVFGDQSRDKTAEQQTRDWEAQKAAERGPARTLDGIAQSLPALTRALKLQNRAARVGFDWPSTGEVLDKLVEEAREVVEARDSVTVAMPAVVPALPSVIEVAAIETVGGGGGGASIAASTLASMLTAASSVVVPSSPPQAARTSVEISTTRNKDMSSPPFEQTSNCHGGTRAVSA